jgi:hypothetical protein
MLPTSINHVKAVMPPPNRHHVCPRIFRRDIVCANLAAFTTILLDRMEKDPRLTSCWTKYCVDVIGTRLGQSNGTRHDGSYKRVDFLSVQRYVLCGINAFSNFKPSITGRISRCSNVQVVDNSHSTFYLTLFSCTCGNSVYTLKAWLKYPILDDYLARTCSSCVALWNYLIIYSD